MGLPTYPGLRLEVDESKRIGILELARPSKSNAFIESMWGDFAKAFRWLDECQDISVVIIRGQGHNFCAGIDLESLQGVADLRKLDDSARANAQFRRKILQMQESFNAIEECRWPVIAAVQGACIGGGLDLIAACDIRLCAKDAVFCLKEIDLAIAADLGSLQRLPPLIGHGRVVEMALSARKIPASEAAQIGLVTRICQTQEDLRSQTFALATAIAKKSPVAATGIKQVMLHARDHSVAQGLEYVATWNGGQALSNDLQEVFDAVNKKRNPVFSRL